MVGQFLIQRAEKGHQLLWRQDMARHLASDLGPLNGINGPKNSVCVIPRGEQIDKYIMESVFETGSMMRRVYLHEYRASFQNSREVHGPAKAFAQCGKCHPPAGSAQLP